MHHGYGVHHAIPGREEGARWSIRFRLRVRVRVRVRARVILGLGCIVRSQVGGSLVNGTHLPPIHDTTDSARVKVRVRVDGQG